MNNIKNNNIIKLFKLKTLIKGMRNNKSILNINGHVIHKSQVALTFKHNYNNVDFEVVLYDLNPMVLTFVKIGTNPVEFVSFKVKNNYSITISFNDKKDRARYGKLRAMLNLNPNIDGPFNFNNFLFNFSQNIPKYIDTMNYQQTKTINHYKDLVDIENVENCNRTEFSHYKNNNLKNEKCSKRNLNKTRLNFGKEEAERCRQANLSSCWKLRKDL